MKEARPTDTCVICAFPGCGKSTLAKKNENYLDADFGNWRKKMNLNEAWYSEGDAHWSVVEKFWRDVMSAALLSGRYAGILVNEPDVLTWGCAHTVGLRALMVIPAPSFRPLWLSNIVTRTALATPDQFTNEDSFIRKLMVRYDYWLSDPRWTNSPNASTWYLTSYDDWDLILSRFADPWREKGNIGPKN